MSAEQTLTKLNDNDNSEMDVVLVHGLIGDSRETWKNKKGELWPEWLARELPNISIYSLGYPSCYFKKWGENEMDIFERANSFLDHMQTKELGEKPLVFVCHSFGGLLTETILRKAHDSENKNWNKISEMTRLIIFLSTPHYGAFSASLINAIIPRFSSKFVKLLANDLGILNEINSQFSTYVNSNDDLKTVIYYEKYNTLGIPIVSRNSANLEINRVVAIATDKNHLNICKPNCTSDHVYSSIENQIKQSLKLETDKNSDANSSSKSPSPKSVAIISFSRPTTNPKKFLPENLINLLELFDNRFLKNDYEWNSDIKQLVSDFLFEKAKSGRPLLLTLDAHASIAFEAGRILNHKFGIKTEIFQPSIHGKEVWHSKDKTEQNLEELNVTDIKIGCGHEIGLTISLARPVKENAMSYITKHCKNIGTILNFELPDGPKPTSVKGGEHSLQLAAQVANSIQDFKEKNSDNLVHIFVAAPNSFVFHLGQHANTIGQYQMYEFDFERTKHGTYLKSTNNLSINI